MVKKSVSKKKKDKKVVKKPVASNPSSFRLNPQIVSRALADAERIDCEYLRAVFDPWKYKCRQPAPTPNPSGLLHKRVIVPFSASGERTVMWLLAPGNHKTQGAGPGTVYGDDLIPWAGRVETAGQPSQGPVLYTHTVASPAWGQTGKFVSDARATALRTVGFGVKLEYTGTLLDFQGQVTVALIDTVEEYMEGPDIQFLYENPQLLIQYPFSYTVPIKESASHPAVWLPLDPQDQMFKNPLYYAKGKDNNYNDVYAKVNDAACSRLPIAIVLTGLSGDETFNLDIACCYEYLPTARFAPWTELETPKDASKTFEVVNAVAASAPANVFHQSSSIASSIPNKGLASELLPQLVSIARKGMRSGLRAVASKGGVSGMLAGIAQQVMEGGSIGPLD